MLRISYEFQFYCEILFLECIYSIITIFQEGTLKTNAVYKTITGKLGDNYNTNSYRKNSSTSSSLSFPVKMNKFLRKISDVQGVYIYTHIFMLYYVIILCCSKKKDTFCASTISPCSVFITSSPQ